MATIRISPDQVRNVANQFKQKSTESTSMANQLQGSVNGLEAEWAGMAKQRFYSDFTEWKQQMQKYAELLNSIGTELERIANTLETTDQQLAGK